MSIKMRVIRHRDDIKNAKEEDVAIFFGFRPSGKDLFELVNIAKNIKVIHLPKSYAKTLSKSMKMFLDMNNIQVIAGGIQDNDSIESCYILNNSVLDTKEDENQDETGEKVDEDQGETEEKMDEDTVNKVPTIESPT